MFGLFSLRTETCCCVISLRTGTITILILKLIFSTPVVWNLGGIFVSGASFWIGDVIFLAIEFSAFYGVFAVCIIIDLFRRKKADFLIPYLVITALFLVSVLLIIIGLLILLPFSGMVMHAMTYDTTDAETEHLRTIINWFYLVYAIILVGVIVYGLIEFHFFKVVLSHYRELKTTLLTVTEPPPVGFIA